MGRKMKPFYGISAEKIWNIIKKKPVNNRSLPPAPLPQ
jgi:hypothetical protein